MDKRLWINIGLISLIILLTILVLNTGEKTKLESKRLSDIDQNNIIQIKVLRKDLDNFEFKFNRNNQHWSLSKPKQLRANKARINAMLRILNVESHAALNPSEVNLDSLGLENPMIIMKLNDHEFTFGNTDAIDQRRYVKFQGKIHLTNDFLYQQLMTNFAFFVDPKLLPENFKIASIEFPENKIELIDNQWHTKPLLDIHQDQLKRLIFNWENTSAISTGEYQANEPASPIIITSTNNETIRFVIISTKPHLILARKDLDIQFHMGSDEAKKLLLNENEDANEKTETPLLELH